MKHEHKQVLLRGSVHIDEGMVELISLIWDNKIETDNSCQENFPGTAWISFLTAHDFHKFINLVAVYPKDDEVFWETLYGRITNCGENDWSYDIHPVDIGVLRYLEDDECIETFSGIHNFESSVSVRFPISDINKLIEILNAKKIRDEEFEKE
jgi:hypothetical protein